MKTSDGEQAKAAEAKLLARKGKKGSKPNPFLKAAKG